MNTLGRFIGFQQCLIGFFAILLLAIPLRVAAVGSEINGSLRVDLATIHDSRDYSVLLMAQELPHFGGAYNKTTAGYFLTLNASTSLEAGLSNHPNGGLAWYARVNSLGYGTSVQCLEGYVSGYDGGGNAIECTGYQNNRVAWRQWHKVELVKYSNSSYWIVRVYDVNGWPADVAKIWAGSDTSLDKAELSFYTPETADNRAGFFFYRPQHINNGWQDWPRSERGMASQNNITVLQGDCPNQYALSTNHDAEPWDYFYAGSAITLYNGLAAGVRCSWLFPPQLLDDASSAITYGADWSSSNAAAGMYQSTSHWTSTYGRTAVVTASVDESLSRMYYMSNNRGFRDVYIDGIQQGSVMSDNVGGLPRYQVVQNYPVAPGSRTFNLTARGSGFTQLDAILIDAPYAAANSTVNDRNPLVLTPGGTWTYANNLAGRTEGTTTWSNIPNRYATFTFKGSSLKWYYTKAYNRGYADVIIDGVPRSRVDLYAPGVVYQQYTEYTNLGSGIHTIHIIVTGEKNPSSSDTFVDIDQFVTGN